MASSPLARTDERTDAASMHCMHARRKCIRVEKGLEESECAVDRPGAGDDVAGVVIILVRIM